ncbi:MAG: hypothetical protein HY514_00255 [Candidatus Aenigmarchaeota archaeon]|nr:hypothetical protein [Candidatus Aenigmarchaeota archaeon]
MKKFAALLMLTLSVFLVSLVSGEQTGTINVTTANSTFLTGLTGNTIAYCNATADCLDSTNYRCLIDYDSQSINDSFTGWCAPASQTSCAHNNAASASYENTTTATNYCINSTAYRTCTSGNWSSNVTICPSGQTCQSGACNATSSSSSSSGTSSSATTAASFIRIASFPSSFNATQGDNITKTVSVTNGNTTQQNITIALSGINVAWYVIAPDKISVMSARANGSFTINFSIPRDAEVRGYTITITASTSNASVTAVVDFTLTILPSTQTIEEQLKPALSTYEEQLSSLESRLAQEKSGFGEVKQKKIENLLALATSKLNSAKSLLDAGNYFEATAESREVAALIADIQAAFEEKEPVPEPQPLDITFIIILVAVLAGAIVIILFVLRPVKERGYSKTSGWVYQQPKERFTDKLKKKFKKKKKEGTFFDEYRKSQ